MDVWLVLFLLSLVVHALRWWVRQQPKPLWIVGRRNGKRTFWQIVGVFSDRERAVRACVTGDHFTGPLLLDRTDQEGEDWEGVFFPGRQESIAPVRQGVVRGAH